MMGGSSTRHQRGAQRNERYNHRAAGPLFSTEGTVRGEDLSCSPTPSGRAVWPGVRTLSATSEAIASIQVTAATGAPTMCARVVNGNDFLNAPRFTSRSGDLYAGGSSAADDHGTGDRSSRRSAALHGCRSLRHHARPACSVRPHPAVEFRTYRQLASAISEQSRTYASWVNGNRK